MKKTLTFLTVVLLTNFIYSQTGSQPFTTSGSFIVPAGVTSITIEVVGGGGNGGSNGTGGGGGGGYSAGIYSVTPFASIPVTIGAAGGTTSVGIFIQATGGGQGISVSNPQVGGGGAGGVGSGGTVNYTGGIGGGGYYTYFGGGGGGAAGSMGNGFNGGNTIPWTGICQTPGGSGGAAGGFPGGMGGKGAGFTDAVCANTDPSSNGLFYGGGGGGGNGNGGGPGLGYSGYALISWVDTSCSDPSNLTALNITQTSAMLDWTENGTATTWNIEWGFQGFALGTGNPQVVLSKPYLLNGLQPATAYDYYVQADCGTDSSGWVGPYTFVTPPCFPIGLDLGVDTILCSDYSITLNAPTTGPFGWSWSTGESSPSITVDTTSLGGNGVYNISVNMIDFSTGCMYFDNITVTFSPCIGIDENNTSLDFAIYPNPSNGLFTIINSSGDIATIEVMNMQGPVVYKNNSNSSSQIIDLRENAKGVYFVNVIADKGVGNYKIVIQ